jgi:hypothetical protein
MPLGCAMNFLSNAEKHCTTITPHNHWELIKKMDQFCNAFIYWTVNREQDVNGSDEMDAVCYYNEPL